MEDQQLEDDTEIGGFEDLDEGWFNTWWERFVLTVLVVIGVCLSPFVFLIYCGNEIATKLGWIHTDD